MNGNEPSEQTNFAGRGFATVLKNISIKWQMLTLVGVAILALGVVGFIGYRGIGQVGEAIQDVGGTDLPSIQGLLIVSEGQTALKAADLEASIYENNYESQEQFASVGEKRRKIWERIDGGWKMYE